MWSRHEPDGLSASTRRSPPWSSSSPVQAHHHLEGNRPGRHDLGEQRRGSRQDHRRRHGQGRARGVITWSKTAASRSLSELEVVEGMQFDRGFSPYFINNPGQATAVSRQPVVRVVARQEDQQHPRSPADARAGLSWPSLLIVAEEVEGEALATLVVNTIRGILVVAVKAPGFGDRRKAMLEDIAILTGGKVIIAEEVGSMLEKVTLADLGYSQARRSRQGKHHDHRRRRRSQRHRGPAQAGARADRGSTRLRQESLARSAAAGRRRGADRRRRHRGRRDEGKEGARRRRCTRPARPWKKASSPAAAWFSFALAKAGTIGGDTDQDAGIKLILRAIDSRRGIIVQNSGDEPSVVVNAVLGGKGNYGYNAANSQYGDMIEMGILDPTKVTRTALQKGSLGRFADADHRSHDLRSAEGESAGGGGGSRAAAWAEWVAGGTDGDRRPPTCRRTACRQQAGCFAALFH